MHLWSAAIGSLSTGSLVENVDSMFGILVCLRSGHGLGSLGSSARHTSPWKTSKFIF